MTMMNGKFTYEARPDYPEHEEKDRVYPGDFEREPATYSLNWTVDNDMENRTCRYPRQWFFYR